MRRASGPSFVSTINRPRRRDCRSRHPRFVGDAGIGHRAVRAFGGFGRVGIGHAALLPAASVRDGGTHGCGRLIRHVRQIGAAIDGDAQRPRDRVIVRDQRRVDHRVGSADGDGRGFGGENPREFATRIDADRDRLARFYEVRRGTDSGSAGRCGPRCKVQAVHRKRRSNRDRDPARRRWRAMRAGDGSSRSRPNADNRSDTASPHQPAPPASAARGDRARCWPQPQGAPAAAAHNG